MKKVKLLLCCLALLALTMLNACSGISCDVITTPEKLLSEINKASDGDVLYVGDIDFTPRPGVANLSARVEIKKNIILRSAYKDRSARFLNASFNLLGSKVTGEVLSCRFDGIAFDGGEKTMQLSASDWENYVDDSGNSISEPLMARYAVSFGGNVRAAFSDCSFSNYMYENGPVIRAYYGDYTANPELEALLVDYSNCRLDILFSDCVLNDNASLFGGGAIYIDGNDNVILRAEDCVFSNNISGCGTFSEGGGACRLGNCDASFVDCVFSENIANFHYKGLDDNACYMSDTDHTQGGAIYSMNGQLTVSGCVFYGNQASLGGAVDLLNADSQIDACVFSGNKATPIHSGVNEDTGPWTGMGMGGAVYITNDPASPVRIYDSVFSDNSALYAYAGIYAFYTDQYSSLMPLGLGSVDLYRCVIQNNTCGTDYDYASAEIYPWASHPGNILDIEYLKFHGCVLADESFERDFPTREDPSAQNDYNFIASPSACDAAGCKVEDIEIPGKVLNAWYAERRYPEADAPAASGLNIILISVLFAVVLLIAAVMISKKKTVKEACVADALASSGNEPALPERPSESSSRIVFTAEDISAFRENICLRQLLTEREMEVMCEYISGSSRSALAEKLCISEATAKTHISNIYSKLGVSSKQELLTRLKSL